MRSKPNKLYKESMKQKSWFCEKINKIVKPLPNMTKKRREKTEINKIKDEHGDITTNTNEIQKIIREYFENLDYSKLENLDEMDKFPDSYNQPKSNQEDINHLNRPITSNEVEAIIKSFPTKKSTEPDGFITKIYQNFKELIPILLKLFQKTEREGALLSKTK
jgi:DNA gyrase/topoisomerase IV subunit A